MLANCVCYQECNMYIYESQFIMLAIIGFFLQLEYKKMLVGLLVHLTTCGYVLPAIKKMHLLFERNHVDVSIVRHFVTEVSIIFYFVAVVLISNTINLSSFIFSSFLALLRHPIILNS